MNEIDSRVVIANVLANKDVVTIKELKQCRYRIEAACNLYVDITMVSIIAAVNANPDLFTLQENVIRRVCPADKLSPAYLDGCFNWRIPKEHKTKVLEILKEGGAE